MPAVPQFERDVALGHGGWRSGHLGPVVLGTAGRDDGDHEQRRPPPHATDTSASGRAVQPALGSQARLHFRRRAVRYRTYHENMRSLLTPPKELSRHPVDVGERSEAIIFAE